MAEHAANKAKILAAVDKARLRSDVAALPRIGFFFAMTQGLVAAGGIEGARNEAERLAAALSAPLPPTHCPICAHVARFAVRDPNGDWTWDCPGGCNP